MSTVQDVSVKISGDAASFVAAMVAAQKALADVERKSGTVAKGLGVAEKGGAALTGVFNKTAMAAVALGKGAALAGVGIATGFLGGGMAAGLKRAEDIQDATVSLTKMLGSAKAAADLTGKALAIVKGTPFAFPDFAVAARELVAYGMAASKVPPILQAIADSAAASGQGTAAVQGLTYAFAQMQAQGRLNMGLVEQISGYGVSALGILANAYGKSVGEMQKMISAGDVSAAKGIAILQSGIENGSKGVAGSFNALAGSAQNLGKTISGSLGNVKAAFARMGASWLAPFTNDLPNALNNGVIPLLDTLGKMGQKLAAQFESHNPLGKFTDALVDVPPMLTNVIAVLTQFGSYLQTISPRFDQIKQAIAPVTTAFGTWSDAFGPLVRLWEQLQSTIAQTTTGPLVNVIATIGQHLIPALVGIGTAITPLLPILVTLGDAYAKGLSTGLDALAKMLTAVAPLLTAFANVIDALPTPLLALGTALLIMSTNGLTIPAMLAGIKTGLDLMATAMTEVAVKTEVMGTVGKAVSEASLAIGGVAEAVTPGGVLLLGLGLLAGAFMLLGDKAKDLKADWQAVVSQVDQYTGAVNDATRASAAKTLVDDGAIAAGQKLGITTKTLVDAAMGQKGATDQVKAAIAAYTVEAEKQAMAGRHGTDAIVAKQAADVKAGGVTKALTDAILGSTGALADQRAAIKAADQANDEATKHQDAFAAAVTAAATGVKGSKDAFDQYTVAGQQNINTIKGLISAGNEWVATSEEQGKSADYISKAQIKVGEGVEKAAEAMLGSKKAAVDYTIGLQGIPDFVKTQVIEDAIKKSADIKTYADEINKLPVSVRTAILEDAAARGIDISKYIGVIKGIPKEVLSQIMADYNDAQNKFKEAKKWAEAWDAMHPTAHVSLSGADTVLAQIAQMQYDASHIDASLASRGPSSANGNVFDGGRTMAFASGGMTRGVSGIARGGANILWAEPETGWEAYISGKSGASARNRQIWMEAGKRLGMFQQDPGGSGSGGGSGATVNLTVNQQGTGSDWIDAALHKIRFNLG